MLELLDISKLYFERVVGLKPRAYGLKEGKYFLYGAPGIGKSSLALLHSARYKKVLYINCLDLRTDVEVANKLILKLFLERNLELLIVDNYTPSVSLPNIKHIILIARSPAHCPSGFRQKHIRALSFEEYISFDMKNISISNLFNLYLKEGNLARVMALEPSYKITYKQDLLQLALGQDFGIFSALLSLQGAKCSTNHIYNVLKKTHKISKDRIYPLLKVWQEQGLIYLIPHISSNAKRLYFYDFSLPECVNAKKHFQALCENMLLLELLALCEKQGKDISLSYDDSGAFICALGAFMCLPFGTKDSIESKLLGLSALAHKRVFIITLSFEGQGELRHKGAHTTWEAISFINLALEFEW